jgi:hypothetical protein
MVPFQSMRFSHRSSQLTKGGKKGRKKEKKKKVGCLSSGVSPNIIGTTSQFSPPC